MSQNKHQACAQQLYQVKLNELPISCPTDEMTLWNAHPKVYIPLTLEQPESICPYCGVKYMLQAE